MNDEMYTAILDNDMPRVLQLLNSGANVNEAIRDGGSALHCASNLGRPEIAELLIMRGADIEQKKNSLGATPLLEATTSLGDQFEVVDLLIKQKAEINTQGIFQKTPLHWATLYTRYNTVKLLLECGADYNILDCHNMIPEMSARPRFHSTAEDLANIPRILTLFRKKRELDAYRNKVEMVAQKTEAESQSYLETLTQNIYSFLDKIVRF